MKINSYRDPCIDPSYYYVNYLDERGEIVSIPYLQDKAPKYVKPKIKRKSVGRENIELKSQVIQLRVEIEELKQKLAAAEASPSYFAGKSRSMAEI